MLSFALEGLKALLLLNGGAVVAMLTYAGRPSAPTAFAQQIHVPMGFLLAGLVSAMFGFVAAYLTQHAVFNEAIENPLRVKHQRWQWCGVAVAILSIMSF